MVIYKSGVKWVFKEKDVSCTFGKRLMISIGFVLIGLLSVLSCHVASADAKESTLSLGIQSGTLGIQIIPSSEGTFGESSNAVISVGTDNFTGYSLSINTVGGTSLINANEDEIESIDSAISSQIFSSDSTYNNKWGFKPSQYISTVNEVDTVVNNLNFLPAPSGQGLLIAKSSAANSVVDEHISTDSYSFSFGARIDNSLSSGTYVATYVVSVVANSIVYNVTYDDNTTDAVNNMPLPNPQVTTIGGDTPVEDSYVTLSSIIPVRDEKRFAGWCDVATAQDALTGDDTCSGTLYQAGDELPVDQTAGPNVTLYAVWVDSLFPIVWNQMDACTFNGATNSNITGTGCERYHDAKFIDTEISLYSQANYNKDYEIHFTIVNYNPADQVNYYGTEDKDQQTFVSDKLGSQAGDKKSPGIIVRRSDKTSIEVNSKYGDTQIGSPYNYQQVSDVSVFRLDGNIYYSINGGPLIFLQELPSSYSQFFGLTTWFGAYPRDDCTGDSDTCNSAKRILQGTLSNMYIRLGEYSDDDIHAINFKKNDGTTANETTYLIKDGGSITTLPSAPTYTNHIFQGWFTAQSGGTEVTTSTVPTVSTDYYAHWLATVALANVTTAQINLQPSESETIVITNSNELEPYEFSSDRQGVAVVDSDTGEVTAMAAGSATITITGKLSGETKTVPVTVSGQTYDVYFDSQGGSAVSPNPIEVGDGGTINPLPISIRAGYQLDGWYTEPNGGGNKLTDSIVFDEDTPTQYYANWEEENYVCKPATTLHTETCTRGSNGCRAAGYSNSGDSAIIEYGSLIQRGATGLVAGNAMTCDIDANGLFDEVNERFYYITTVGNNAALLYYKSIDNNENEWDPALTLLPTSNTVGWTNPNLVTFGAGDYNGKVARYMSYDEAVTTCGNSTTNLGSNGRCTYILEQSNFAYTTIRDGYWLGSTNNARVQTSSRSITTKSGKNGVRPMIEVPMDYVSLHVKAKFNITFEPHNETDPITDVVDEGDSLSTKIPADPIYANHLFRGWFTAVTGGTQIDANTIPSDDSTYHAQWLKTVTLAQLARETIAVEPSGNGSIVVVNSAELEPYTFSSNDNQIATVDSATGEIFGVANGTTTITMTGTTSGATKTITVNVTTLLPVTQAIIGNTDLTTTMGGQTTIIVTNSAELEPYTFSSSDVSIATVDAAGIITGVGAGITNIIMTGSTSGLTRTFEVEITAAPVTMRAVTFNPNGGSFSNPSDSLRQVEDGTAVGALPTPTKANHMFFGWYKDNGTFYQEVYPEEVIDDQVTYYAKWVEDTASFPIVWAETNACTFNGTSNLTGDYCLEDAVSGNSIDKTKHYIDTAVQLFTQANFQKDFEIGLNIVSFNISNSPSQATFVTSKAENLSGWPGFTLRRATTTDNLEFTERFSMNSQAISAPAVAIDSVNQVKIARIGEKIYYSWNGAPYTFLQDIKDNTTRFDTNVWFGATLNSAGTGSQRPIYATLTDMYIKLGVPTDYVIELDVNDGTMSEPSSFTVTIGDELGTLPTPTPPNENYTFVGWFDESVSPAVQVTSTTRPDGNKKYIAHYSYDSSDEPVIFNIANNALQGYQTLINSWVPSPINITTFNESSPINDSTWGNTTELSEKQFWEGIKGNFENNLCSIPSYSDSVKPLNTLSNWGNGSVDCSKPRAYDTKIGAALNVYLDDENGAQVAYANATNGIIHNMIPGQTYYWEKADDSTVYGYVTATSVNGRRMVEFSGNRNTRDLGGLPVTYTDSNNQTVTGTVAYGRLFRGERLWNTPKQEFYNLGINKQYDVGDPTEYANDTKLDEYKWDPVVHYNFDYHTGDENNASSNYMKAWTAVTDIMTDITSVNNPKNIYFHCRVGSDRTGTTAYLLEGLLGVPDEARYEEYELSNLSGMYDRTRYYKQKSSSNNLKFVFMMEYVKTNADIVAWYMRNPNANMSLIQNFRNAMVDVSTVSGSQANNSAPLLNTLNTDPDSTNTTNTVDGSLGYENPLGVSVSTPETYTNDNSGSILGLAAVGLGVVAGELFVFSKYRESKKEEN